MTEAMLEPLLAPMIALESADGATLVRVDEISAVYDRKYGSTIVLFNGKQLQVVARTAAVCDALERALFNLSRQESNPLWGRARPKPGSAEDIDGAST
jgi:hypothetical protein